jgi:hypothetical protein
MGNFNTVGILQNTPAPSASKAQDANAQVKPTAAEIDSLDALQMLLDVVGLIPGAGAPADLINGLISAARGDLIGAGLSLFGVVPIAGEAATVAKIAAKSEKYLQALEVVAKKVMPHLPARLQRTLQDAIDAAKKKIEEIAGKNKPAPAPSPAPAAGGGKGDGGKVKGEKKKLECGEIGKYGEQKKRSGDNKYDRDHVPSKAALIKKAEQLANKRDGDKLTSAQIKAIENLADVIVIPKATHKNASPTYGGKNTAERIRSDADDLSSAMERDLDSVLADLEKRDKECAKAYRRAAQKLREQVKRSGTYYDDFLNDILDNF